MPVSIQLTSALRSESRNADLCVRAKSVRDALRELEDNHPDLHRSVCDETGSVRQHINLFVNSDLVPRDAGLDTPLADGDVLSIFSDGIPEATRDGNDFLGDQAVDTAMRNHRQAPLKDMRETILQSVHDFLTPSEASDDVTLMLLRRCPDCPGGEKDAVTTQS